MNTHKIGEKGEDLAEKILKSKGYEILERNYRFKRAELDIICLKKSLLVFVEVKARSSFSFGFPEESVDESKAKNLIEAAEDYILAINWNKDIRFDIISINLKSPDNFLHIEDAFY